MTPRLAHSLQILRMKNSLTEVTLHQLFRREADILVHRPIRIDDTSIRPEYYDRLRNRIHRLSQFSLRCSNLVECRPEGRLRSFALDCDSCDTARVIDQTNFTWLRMT